jgi:6-pyruvoyltetrahydropterin/6-carboxytetrahydropterin synthase
MTPTTSAIATTTFEVHVSKDTFKFNAAHFVAFKGFRERLHGHNYKVSVRLLGNRNIGADGYLIDFGEVKGVTKEVCKELNEHFLCPTLSDVMEITERTEENGQVAVLLNCEDGSNFVFPKSDCAMLPIVHATTEELAIYIWGKILNGLNAEYLLKRGIHTMEINVAEAVGQDATFRMRIPHDAAPEGLFDVATYLTKGEVVPMPCLPLNGSKKRKAENGGCSDKTCNCLAPSEFSAKLQKLAEGLSRRGSPMGNELITSEYLESLMNK